MRDLNYVCLYNSSLYIVYPIYNTTVQLFNYVPGVSSEQGRIQLSATSDFVIELRKTSTGCINIYRRASPINKRPPSNLI